MFFINVDAQYSFQWKDKQEAKCHYGFTALCLPSSAGREGIRERLQQRRLCPLSFKTGKLLVRANCFLARGADFSWLETLGQSLRVFLLLGQPKLWFLVHISIKCQKFVGAERYTTVCGRRHTCRILTLRCDGKYGRGLIKLGIVLPDRSAPENRGASFTAFDIYTRISDFASMNSLQRLGRRIPQPNAVNCGS